MLKRKLVLKLKQNEKKIYIELNKQELQRRI